MYKLVIIGLFAVSILPSVITNKHQNKETNNYNIKADSIHKIIDKSVDAFNDGNLSAFINCFSDTILVRNFPNDTTAVGKENLHSGYQRFMQNNKDAQVKVVNRMVYNTFVVDKEIATIKGKTHEQIAIYTIENNLITSMTFIMDSKPKYNPVVFAEQQLVAYNNRDIDAFVNVYSDTVQVLNFPDKLRYKGNDKMREGFTGFFESTPNLHCKLVNRMQVGNVVIDHEYITANGSNFSAIGIYEMNANGITTATFLR